MYCLSCYTWGLLNGSNDLTCDLHTSAMRTHYISEYRYLISISFDVDEIRNIRLVFSDRFANLKSRYTWYNK